MEGKINFELMRKKMVEEQLIARGIREKNVITAFMNVPRERFVPKEEKKFAYEDSPLPIGEGQTISQPYMVALMTDALNVRRGDKVLEIGTGSGYQSAILAEMGCIVYSLERIQDIAEKAALTLKKLGYAVTVKTGDGTAGWEEYAPYDGIIVTAGGPAVPPSLLRQLAEEKNMVMPVGDPYFQELMVITRTAGGDVKKKNLGGCRFVRLMGKEGWNQ